MMAKLRGSFYRTLRNGVAGQEEAGQGGMTDDGYNLPGHHSLGTDEKRNWAQAEIMSRRQWWIHYLFPDQMDGMRGQQRS